MRVPKPHPFKREFHEAVKALGEVRGVNGVHIARRIKDGIRTDEICLRFHVDKKLPESELKPSEILPSFVGKARVNVVESKPRLCIGSEWTVRLPVVQPGISISGDTLIASGSLGPIVIDDDTGWICALTCWHVLAKATGLSVGDIAINPSLEDGGAGPGDSIGYVSKVLLGSGVDGAMIRLNRHSGIAPFGAAPYNFLGSKNAEIGDSLMKSGRSTGLTTGEVDAWGSQSFSYSDYGQGSVNISCNSIIPNSGDDDEEIVQGGDSGSPWWLPSTGELIGYTVGEEGSGTPFVAYACDISEVLTKMSCSLPEVGNTRLSALAGFDVSSKTKFYTVGSTLRSGSAEFLGMQVSAFDNSPVEFADLDEYAVSEGYADGDIFLAAMGYDPAEEEPGEEGYMALAFAKSKGYETIDDFVSAQEVPSVEDILTDGGAYFV